MLNRIENETGLRLGGFMLREETRREEKRGKGREQNRRGEREVKRIEKRREVK